MAEGIKIHELTPGNGSVTLVANDRFVFDHNSSGDLWETKQVSYQKLIQEISTEIGNNIIIDGGPPSGGSQEPQEGDLYFDYIDNILYVYVCNPPGGGTDCGWEIVTGGGISSGIIISDQTPTVDNNGDSIKNGDVWWNPDTNELHIRYQGEWYLINPPAVIVSPSEPTQDGSGSPIQEGDLWFDNTQNILYVYANGAWEPVSSESGGGVIINVGEPTKDNNGDDIVNGDVWWDSDTKNLYIYYGGSWQILNPPAVIISPSEPTTNNGGGPIRDGDLWFDNTQNILYVYDDGTWEPVNANGGVIINVGEPDNDNNGNDIVNGDIWWDPDTKNLYIYYGGSWQILNPPSVITSRREPSTNNGGGPLRDGDQWFDTDNNVLYVYHDGTWKPVNAPGGGIIVGPDAPCQDNDGNPVSEGDLWYDNVNNNILIFICDDPLDCSDLNCWKAIIDIDNVPVTGIKDGDAINVQPKGTGDEASGVVTVNVRYDEDRGLDVDGTSNELFVVLEADGGLGFGPDGGIGIDLNNGGNGLGQLGENEIIIGQPGGGIGVGNLGDLLLGGDGIELEINNNIITISADIGDGEINFEPGDALSAVGDNATANQNDDTTKTFNVNVTEDDLYPGIFIDDNNSLDVAVHEAPEDDMIYVRYNGEWVGWDEVIAACDGANGEPIYLVGDGGVDKILGDSGTIDGDALLYESALEEDINNIGLILGIEAGDGIDVSSGCDPEISLSTSNFIFDSQGRITGIIMYDAGADANVTVSVNNGAIQIS